ncbi:lysine N(6)-hydroxylase/L-ornithine N(5)-oxygenase family protein [Streptomyces sp. NPDC015220]|uniref:lysine N(6)-hydroxylase/L-ornithine N(5)-oxygenase family protein n=1 Tax=Streptomyces sp. NPDC015220 TaxID=3364947 RepID=UPI00370095C1
MTSADTLGTVQAPVHDILGIGFGPSNLALAIAVREHNDRVPDTDRLTSFFLEKQIRFGWHRDMLIDGATMQVSFLKDLATMRNPGSRYGFLPYLQAKGRLVDFINHQSFFPTRAEFHDYLEWAAADFADQVAYGETADAVRLTRSDGEPLFQVTSHRTRAPERTTVRLARHVVLAPGLTPRLPPGVTESKRVWHSSGFLSCLDALAGAEPRRFVVVGAGQSAAEITEYLHRRFTGAEVCAVFERYGYSPADDSPYANRVFDPEAVDRYFHSDDDLKRRLLAYHANTNYAVADLDLVKELYRREYQEGVSGPRRLRILNVSRLVAADDLGDHVDVTVRDLSSGSTTRLTADAVVYATGYRPADLRELLSSVAGHVQWDERGLPRVARDYRLTTSPRTPLPGGVYLQGGTEHTHGISSSLLSVSAVRAQEICDSILAGRRTPHRAPAGTR